MFSFKRFAGLYLACLTPWICACAKATFVGGLSYLSATGHPLGNYQLTGDASPVLDPSLMRQGSTWYAFSTDVAGDVAGFEHTGSLPIRCSTDKIQWNACGSVFPNGMPSWISAKFPGVNGLWAPDISYFNAEYHLYYNGSTLGSQRTVIGLVTNTTLDPTSSSYAWIDRGAVLESKPGDDFNALDPNILIDLDGSVWLTYGSYWSGIKQLQIDPSTGLLLASNSTRYDLATRPGVPGDAIEGASLVRHGNYYYLFVSVDHCCAATIAEDNYKEAVGRSTSPHGPFVDEAGTAMMNGGGSVLLQSTATWNAPGGATAYLDKSSGESLLIFHAQNLAKGGTPYQWLKTLTWQNDWPAVGN